MGLWHQSGFLTAGTEGRATGRSDQTLSARSLVLAVAALLTGDVEGEAVWGAAVQGTPSLTHSLRISISRAGSLPDGGISSSP